MRISDWSSDVCSSDLHGEAAAVDLVDGGELPELEALQFVDQRRLVADVGFVEGGRPRVDRIGKKVRVPRGGALGRVRREGRDNEEEWRPHGGGAADRRRRVTGDRKSTRMNSRH